MPNRSQQLYAQAIDHVGATLKQSPAFRSVYRDLCHQTPALLFRNGLCQTVAFLDAKSRGDRGQAHALLLDHLAETLGVDRAGLARRVSSGGDNLRYARDTLLLLEALGYYRQLAVSLLGDEKGGGNRARTDGGTTAEMAAEAAEDAAQAAAEVTP